MTKSIRNARLVWCLKIHVLQQPRKQEAYDDRYRKKFNEIQHLFTINSFSKTEIERHFPNLVKSTCRKSIDNIILNNKCRLSPLVFSLVVEFLLSATRKGNKRNSYWKGNNECFILRWHNCLRLKSQTM